MGQVEFDRSYVPDPEMERLGKQLHLVTCDLSQVRTLGSVEHNRLIDRERELRQAIAELRTARKQQQ